MRESFHHTRGFSNSKFPIASETPILIFVFAFILNSCGYSESKKFDSAQWKSNVESRYRMVENIIDSKLLLGMNKEEVIELLGSETEAGPCANCIGYSTNNPDQGFSVDHEVLEIVFDDHNTVTEVGINSW